MRYSVPKTKYSRSRGSNERTSNCVWKKNKTNDYEPENNFWSVIQNKKYEYHSSTIHAA
jgi:hypothetical protein